MAYQTFREFNSTGLEGFLTYPATVVPIFIPLLLFTFYIIIVLGVYFSQQRLRGTANIFAAFAVAGYATTILTFAMALIPDLINTLTMVVVISVAVIGTLMLLISRNR